MSVITVSRQFGAGGRTLGEMVTQKLGYELYDNEVIQMVAEQAKVSANSVDALEKKTGGIFRKIINKASRVASTQNHNNRLVNPF